MYWANFLHIYQPPTQTRRILERVVSESYRRILKELKNSPGARLTLGITGGLTELLDQNGFGDVIADIKMLLERGQIELTASAKYHPLLPKLPKDEIVRQIQLDVETNRRYFGDAYHPKGFFPPEAAYNRELAQIVADLGFEWILAEELSYNGRFGAVKYDRTYGVEGVTTAPAASATLTQGPTAPRQARGGPPERSLTPNASGAGFGNLKIFFRERDSSFKILSGQLGTIKLFEDYLGERLNRNEYLLTAMDGETFGHHRPGMEKLLFEIYQSPRVRTITISQLPELFPRTETVKTLPSTWALMEKDIEKNAPFSRWDDPENEIHRLQWELTDLAIDSVRNSNVKSQMSNLKCQKYMSKVKSQDSFDILDVDLPFAICHLPLSGQGKLTPEQKRWCEARKMLDRALHSDQYWWASARPWWSLEMIERGANELKEAVQVEPGASYERKQKALALYYQIITQGFEWQRTGKVEEIARREDEEIRERTDESLPKLPPEEIAKMIGNLHQEMLVVAKNQEYERASQLRDRIKELEEYAAAS